MSVDSETNRRRDTMVLRFRAHDIPTIYNPSIPMRVCGQAFFYQSSETGVAALCSYDASMDQWAAYIGGFRAATEEEVNRLVLSRGAKLSEQDARKLFPGLADVEYRR